MKAPSVLGCTTVSSFTRLSRVLNYFFFTLFKINKIRKTEREIFYNYRVKSKEDLYGKL